MSGVKSFRNKKMLVRLQSNQNGSTAYSRRSSNEIVLIIVIVNQIILCLTVGIFFTGLRGISLSISLNFRFDVQVTRQIVFTRSNKPVL